MRYEAACRKTVTYKRLPKASRSQKERKKPRSRMTYGNDGDVMPAACTADTDDDNMGRVPLEDPPEELPPQSVPTYSTPKLQASEMSVENVPVR